MPPLMALAVKVVLSPVQILTPDAVMFTEAATGALTDIFMLFETMIVSDAHAALPSISQ